MDDRMQHLVQDSMSARVLRQVTLMKRRGRGKGKEEKGDEQEKKEDGQEKEKGDEQEENMEEVMEEELVDEEVKEELREEKANENLITGEHTLSTEDREKILRLVLLVLIPDLRK